MSGGLKVYLDLMSPPCRSLYMILKQSGTPFETVNVALRRAEQHTPEFKKINKLQALPCIVEGDFKLAESVAILRYLSATNRISERLYTSDVKERALIDEFLEWQHAVRSQGVNYFRLSWVMPMLTGEPTPEGILKKAEEDMEKSLESLEDIWLASSKFVAGGKLSVADIFGVCTVLQTKLSSYNVRKKFPKVADWVENVRQSTNPDFDDAHKFVYKNSTISKM